MFSIYAQDSREHYPAVVEGRLYQISAFQWIAFPYWQVVMTWPGVIYDYLPRDDTPRLFMSPGSRRGLGMVESWPSSYIYSTSFVGDSQLWTPGAQPLPAHQMSQRMSSVVFPSAKALLWDAEVGWVNRDPRMIGDDLAETTPIGMADGAVRNAVPAGAIAPIANPFPHPFDHQRLHNTVRGVCGRDY